MSTIIIAKHHKKPLLAAMLSFFMASVPAISFADPCTQFDGKTELDLMAMECVNGGVCTTDESGPLLNLILTGQCAPVLGMYKGIQGPPPTEQARMVKSIGPATGLLGVLPTDKIVGNLVNKPNVPQFTGTYAPDGTTNSPVPVVIPSVNSQTPICLSAGGTIPPLPCGGAIPLLNTYNALNSSTTSGQTLAFGNLVIGAPPPNLASTIASVITNTLADSKTCGNTNLTVPNNTLSLVVPPLVTSTPITSATATVASSQGVTTLPGTTFLQIDLSKPGFTQFPTGASLTLPDGDTYTLAAGASVISLGNGTIVLPMTGPLPPVLAPGEAIADPTLYQQSLPIPNALTQTIENMYDDKSGGSPSLLPPYAVREDDAYLQDALPANSNYTKVQDTAYQAISKVILPSTTGQYPQLVGYYITYPNTTSPLLVTAQSVKNYNIDLPNAKTTLANVNTTANTSTVATPSGSFLSIPLGTPVTIKTNQAGSINLPAGGTITLPVGSIYNGVTLTVPKTVTIPLGNTLAVSGTGVLSFGANTITLPTGTASINLSTSEIGNLPASLPVNIETGGQVSTPQTSSQPKAASSC